MLHIPRRGVVAGCAAVAAVLCLTASPSATADPTPARGSDIPAAVLKAMERDLGLTAAEARTRIANEYRAGSTARALRTKLGTSFGGAWVSGRTGELTVATTDRAQRAAITRAGASPELVDHSLRDLDAAKAALDRAATRRAAGQTAAHVWYVDVRSNSVVVQSATPSKAAAFVTDSRAQQAMVRVKTSAERPRPYADLRGGDAYYIEDDARCSIGFSVTKDDQSGFVTAGHCGDAGDSTTGYNHAEQGDFQDSGFPGTDYAWVAANDDWTAKPLVRGKGGDVKVAGSKQAPTGSAVCRSGSTSGWHCGTIQQLNASVTYPEGTVNGVTRTSVCAEPGDSGGSFISGNQAQGVTSGGSGDCTAGGTTYFQPVNPILKTYGLTLSTG